MLNYFQESEWIHKQPEAVKYLMFLKSLNNSKTQTSFQKSQLLNTGAEGLGIGKAQGSTQRRHHPYFSSIFIKGAFEFKKYKTDR